MVLEIVFIITVKIGRFAVKRIKRHLTKRSECSSCQQLRLGCEDTQFSYDANGNVVEMLENGVPAISSIQYDHRNLPVSLINRNGDLVTYRYNAAGEIRKISSRQRDREVSVFVGSSGYMPKALLRSKKVGSQSAEHYIMDGDQTVAVYQNGAVKYWNILANGVEGRRAASGEKFYYLKDHLGSTRAVVNNNGTVVEAHDYYPFGLLMPGRDYQSAERTKELFTGKERDAETNLDYFGARYYWPAGGRWWSVDILTEKYPSLSSYNYSSNNPINNFDLDGRAIYRAKEGYIYGDRAKALTLSTMNTALKGESAEIDFVAKSNNFIDLWDIIRTPGGSYTHATFNPNIIRFGNKIIHNTPIGNQTFLEFTVNTQYSFQKISSVMIDIRDATNTNNDIVQLVFSNEAGQDIIIYTNTIAEIQKILQKSGKKAVKKVTGVRTKTITVKDKKGNIIDQRTIIEKTYIYVIEEAVEDKEE